MAPEAVGSLAPAGLADETCHLLTGVLLLLALPASGPAFTAGVLIGSVAIDVDHIPALAGWDGLTEGTGRPYSHSLATPLALGVVALALRPPWRPLAAGLALGVAAHLWRDLATGSSVPLLWPFSREPFEIPYGVYVVSLVVAALMIVRLRDARVSQSA